MINEPLESEISLLPRPDDEDGPDDEVFCALDMDNNEGSEFERGWTFGQIAQLQEPRIPIMDQPEVDIIIEKCMLTSLIHLPDWPLASATFP